MHSDKVEDEAFAVEPVRVPPVGAESKRGSGTGFTFALLAVVLLVIGFGTLSVGSTENWSVVEVVRGLGAKLGWSAPLSPSRSVVFDLHLYRALTGIGVGAGLALSGALLQGVFRNDLAAPSIIGVTSGASLGATLAILSLGAAPASFALGRVPISAAVLVSVAALVGSLLLVTLVASAARIAGRMSISTLLLVGIAANATVAGLLTLIQSIALEDYQLSRAILTWGFGSLDDRLGYHAALALGGATLAALACPFVVRELDLLAAGEDDALSLGVDVRRVRAVALVAACVAAASAVASAGQIGFVGLVVPHIARSVVGRSHARLIPMCLLLGPVFLLGLDLTQRLLFLELRLHTGVLMAIVGGPLFFLMLLRRRAQVRTI